MIEDNNVEIDAIIEDDSIVLETDLDYRGERGPVGETPDITIGKIDTLSPEDNAYVEKEGTKENITLNFGIPKGETGAIGPVGPTGPSGVYVGSDEPQNPDVDVWIDPTVNPENYVKETELDDKLNSMIESGELIGPPGPQGVPGNDGTDGTDGADGVGITTITSGQSSVEEDKTITPVTVQKTDGSSQIFNVEAKNGIDGQNGQDGKDGVNGQDGLTPSIGENGNWYLGDTDTGKPSRGEVGPSPDLTDYVKNTDYANGITGGTVKSANQFFVTSSNGYVYSGEVSKNAYKSIGNSSFISKGTLENIKDDYVGSSQPVQDLTATVTNVQNDQDESMPKQTASGEIVSADDALAYKTFNVTVDGASEQENTTGTQLFNANAIVDSDIVVSDNGKTITMPVVSEGNGGIDTTVTLQELCPTLQAGDIVYLNFERNLGMVYNNFINLAGSDALWFVNTQHEITQAELDGTVYLYGNRFIDGETEQCIISNFRIIKNNEDVFEPYTGGQPSPNPDYPQKITTLTFDKITRCGKNLLPNNLTSQTINGISVIVNDDKSITVNGTAEKRTVFYLYSRNTNEIDYILPKGINFILKTPRLESAGINFQLGLYEPNKTEEYITANGINDRQFKLDNYKIVNYFALIVEEGQTVDLTCYPQLEIGIESTEYEPYQGQTYDIDLQGNEMVELPNGVKDELIIDKYGNVNLIKNVGKAVLTGSENWKDDWQTNATPDYIQFYLSADFLNNNYTPATSKNTLVNRFKADGSVWIFSKEMLALNKDVKYSLQIKMLRSRVSDLTSFKEWLSTHNVIVYYRLATPEVIPLGKLTDLITTINGTNNISINGNIPTTISTTYALDIKKYIDNKLAEISTAMIEEG